MTKSEMYKAIRSNERLTKEEDARFIVETAEMLFNKLGADDTDRLTLVGWDMSEFMCASDFFVRRAKGLRDVEH